MTRPSLEDTYLTLIAPHLDADTAPTATASAVPDLEVVP